MVRSITSQAIVPYYSEHDSNPSQLFAKRLQEFCGAIDSLLENRVFSLETRVSLEDIKHEMLALIKDINGGKIFPENQIQEFISFFSDALKEIEESARQEHTQFQDAPTSVRLIQYSANAHLSALPSSEDAYITKIYNVFRERIDCLQKEHQAELDLQKKNFSEVLDQVKKTFEEHEKLFNRFGERIKHLEEAEEIAKERVSSQEEQIKKLQAAEKNALEHVFSQEKKIRKLQAQEQIKETKAIINYANDLVDHAQLFNRNTSTSFKELRTRLNSLEQKSSALDPDNVDQQALYELKASKEEFKTKARGQYAKYHEEAVKLTSLTPKEFVARAKNKAKAQLKEKGNWLTKIIVPLAERCSFIEQAQIEEMEEFQNKQQKSSFFTSEEPPFVQYS